MIINSQGFGHFVDGINNQDFGVESTRAIIILDGCSGAKYSEVGTKLFAQVLQRKEEWDNAEKFEEKVKETFEELIQMFKKYYPTEEDLENFIVDNMSFSIIALFKTEEKFILKVFGDGYVITENNVGLISYIRFYYGKYPPYYVYRYCKFKPEFKEKGFKTIEFEKSKFQQVVIATDGIMPIAKGMLKMQDKNIVNLTGRVEMEIKKSRQTFYDDVTIGAFPKGN